MHKQLFYKRLSFELRQKWKILRSIVDWTIALYLLVPVIIFGSMYYYSLWISPPVWMTRIPFFIFVCFLFILLSVGSVRSFLERADSLFLIQYPSFLHQVIWRGMIYSFFIAFVNFILIMLLALPLLRKGYRFTIFQVIQLSFLLFFMITLQRFFNRFLVVRMERGWQSKLVHFVAYCMVLLLLFIECFVYTKASYLIIVFLLILLTALYFLVKDRLQFEQFFLREVEEERKAAMSWTMLALTTGGHVQKAVTYKKPWLFPKSKRLWKSDDRMFRIVESFMKEYFRTDTNLRFYIMITVYSSSSFFIAPWWLSLIILFFSLFALYKQSTEKWKLFADTLLVRLYCQNGELLFTSAKARTYILVPAIIWYAIVYLCVVNVWVGLGVFVLVIVLSTRYVLFP